MTLIETVYGFISASSPFLETLNMLRNRIWHRGRFILRYPALDQLVCQYVLPFVSQVLALPSYTGKEAIWRFTPLDCGMDPLAQLERHGAAAYSAERTAFFKELMRAAYENEIRSAGGAGGAGWQSVADHLNLRVSRRAKAIAEAELEDEHPECRPCPVCGLETLLVYDDIEAEGEDPETGMYEKAWNYTYEATCVQCSFAVNYHLDNPSVYGLKIPDFWTAKEI